MNKKLKKIPRNFIRLFYASKPFLLKLILKIDDKIFHVHFPKLGIFQNKNMLILSNTSAATLLSSFKVLINSRTFLASINFKTIL